MTKYKIKLGRRVDGLQAEGTNSLKTAVRIARRWILSRDEHLRQKKVCILEGKKLLGCMYDGSTKIVRK
mgnify:CR=1 FL=1